MGFLTTKIGRRLLATFLAVSLLPLLVAGWFAVTRSEAALKQESRFGLSAASSAAGGKLREFLASLKQGTLALSLDSRIVDALQANPPVEARTSAQNIPAVPELDPILKWYQERIFDAQEIFVISDEGIVLASSNPENTGRNVGTEEYFTRGKESFYPGDVTRDSPEGITWIMTAPVKSASGNLLAVAACRVHPQVLSALTTGRRSVAQGARRQLFRIGETGETYIVNRNRLMLTESRDIPNAVLNLKVNSLPVRKAFEENEEVLADYEDYRGITVSGTSVLFPDMGWVAVTEIDFTQSFAPIRHLRNGLLVTVLILGVLVTLLAWQWTARVVTPIRNLRDSDQAMAAGNEDAAFAPEDNLPDNEIGYFVRLRNERVKTLFEKQRQLFSEQRRREKASAELQEMSYSIVHDMRAPLRAISNFATILEEEAAERLNSEHRDLLNRMGKAASRMDQLISDMLSYNRLAREELPLHTVNVSRLLSDILQTYPVLIAVREHIHIAPDLPLVHGNEAALMQCFTSLLDNAVKFTRPGIPPSIHIKAETANRRVRIFVEDNGTGIPQHMQQKVFGIFQQGALAHGTTGIGLALVRKAAERMGGTVGVRSEVGQGSCFWIELEAAHPSPEPAFPSG